MKTEIKSDLKKRFKIKSITSKYSTVIALEHRTYIEHTRRS